MDNLVAVEVLAEPPLAIVSVVGYREVDEFLFGGDGRPRFVADGNPHTRKVRLPDTQDVTKGGTAYLDPAETQIHLLVQAGLVKILPAKGKK